MQVDDADLFDIDKNQLDSELLVQPKLYMKYSLELADARAALEEAKAQQQLKEGRCFVDVKNNPEEHGLSSPTVDAIKAKVAQLALRQTKKTITASHKVETLRAIVQTLDHRKSALENLVRLHGQNYFSSPTVDSEGNATVTKSTDTRRKRRGKETS